MSHLLVISAGMGSPSSTRLLGDRLAAAQNVGLPACRHALQRECQRLGHEAGVIHLHADGRDFACANRLRRIVGQEEQTLYAWRIALSVRPGQRQNEENEQSKQSAHRGDPATWKC